MDIVIIADFCGSFKGDCNSRFLYLAELLSADSNHSVEVITSDFDHGTKTHFTSLPTSDAYRITMLHEPAYRANVCLKRFYSHYKWGKNIKKYLKQRQKPDVVYCAMPTLTAAKEAGKYCKKNNIKFVVDIQDLWPEAYRMVFNIPVLSSIIFAPLTFIANSAYKSADAICAVSQTYVDRGLSVNQKQKEGQCVFLGTQLSDFDSYVDRYKNGEFDINLPQKRDDQLWLGYCGTLGASYDLICVFDALDHLRKKGYTPPKFIIMGQGPRQEEFEKYAQEKNLDVIFTGSLKYELMCGVLCECDIVVNPIKGGSAASIINKHGDYAASGLPVINSQNSPEYRKLVDTYYMGLNCNNGDFLDMAEKLETLMLDSELRATIGANARRCAEEKFDRKNSYKRIINVITSKSAD